MTGHAHDLAEWAQALSLGLIVWGSYGVVHALLVDAHRSDFPRSWQAAVYARSDADWAYASGLHYTAVAVLFARLAARDAAQRARALPRDAALTGAALLALLTIRPEALR